MWSCWPGIRKSVLIVRFFTLSICYNGNREKKLRTGADDVKGEILLGILMVSCIVGNWGRWSPLGIVATGCSIVAFCMELKK